jgi:hypothetical protein
MPSAGQQPVIPPLGSQCFEYASGTDCNTPTGMQAGSLLVSVLLQLSSAQGREMVIERSLCVCSPDRMQNMGIFGIVLLFLGM